MDTTNNTTQIPQLAMNETPGKHIKSNRCMNKIEYLHNWAYNMGFTDMTVEVNIRNNIVY